MSDEETLSGLITAAVSGTNRFYEGTIVPRKGEPRKGFRVPIPEALQPFARLYGSLRREHTALHGEMEQSGSEVRSPRHLLLHEWLTLLDIVIKSELSHSRPEGAGADGVIVSDKEFVWENPSETGFDPFELLAALLGDRGGMRVEIVEVRTRRK